MMNCPASPAPARSPRVSICDAVAVLAGYGFAGLQVATLAAAVFG